MTSGRAEVVTYWRGVVGTLAQRGLLRRRQDGEEVIPQAVGIVEPERVVFVLDMHNLGGVSRERWLDRALWEQMRATLQGRRVFVADSAGLAVVVARNPAERRRLPRRVVLTPERVPVGAYKALLGESAGGDVVVNLAEGERAILVGGTSGAGKTRAILSLVLQLMHKHGPEELALAIVDLKRLDFTPLTGLPHLVRSVATTESEADDLVAWCVQEMERRQAVMQAAGVTRWDKLPPSDRFPLLLVVVDEVADFGKSEVMGGLVELARKGRASGVSLVLATQRPDAEVLSRQVKANVTTRMAFRVTDNTESRIILDRVGAEKLGRVGLCLTNAGGKWRRVQVAYVPDEAVGEWLPTASGQVQVLGEVERDLVRYALERLEGAFKVNALYQAHRGRISKRALTRLGQEWEMRGWLTPPADATSPRMVTAELAELAGCTPGQENGDTVTGVTGGDRR